MSAMFARKNAMKKTMLLVAAGVVAGMVACATPQAPESPEGATGNSQLSAISVTSEDDATLVTMVGVQDARMTVGEQSEPWAIQVDLADVTAEEMAPVAVYDGVVDQVSAASFTDALGTTHTRVEIALADQAWHEIVEGADGVSLRIHSGGDAQASSDAWAEDAEMAAEDDDVWSDAPALGEGEGEEMTAEEALPAPPMASTLTGVQVDAVEGGVLVHLMANGAIGQTESFTLDNPDRLVIDLPGMTSEVKQGRVESDSSMVASVRIGAHADKVRVVMDGGSGAMGFQGKQLMPAADGMWVAVGEGDVVAAALEAGLDASDAAWSRDARRERAGRRSRRRRRDGRRSRDGRHAGQPGRGR